MRHEHGSMQCYLWTRFPWITLKQPCPLFTELPRDEGVVSGVRYSLATPKQHQKIRSLRDAPGGRR